MYIQLSKCNVRLLEVADIAAAARRTDDHSLWIVTNGARVVTRDIACDWLSNRLTSPASHVFSVDLDGETVGFLILAVQAERNSHSAEINGWLEEASCGRGIMTEALNYVTSYAFDTLNLLRIFARVCETNAASMRVLEKCGYCLEGWLRKSTEKDTKLADEAIYAKLAESVLSSNVRRKIVVVPYNSQWPVVFEQLKRRIEPALRGVAVAIEHVGSTAVPGLAAKPIIDMFLIVETDADVPKAIAALAKIGYVHEGNLGIVGREAFKHPPEMARHHLYVVVHGNESHRSDMAFRDYLRAHSDARDTYEVIKRGAAERFPNEINGYIALKGPIVRGILKLASCQE